MAKENVEIILNATQSGNTKTTLDALLKQLKEINNLSTIELASNDPEVKKLKANVEAIVKEKEKENKLSQEEIQMYKLKKKELDSLNKGRSESLQLIRSYMEELKSGNKITQEQWENLDLVVKTERKRLEITQNVNKESEKNLKLVTDVEKAHFEALKINAQLKEKMGKDEYEAHLINNKISIDKEKAHFEALQINAKLREKNEKDHYEAILRNSKIETDKQKVIYEAYKMNDEFDRKKYQNQVSLEKQHFEALKMNEAFNKKIIDNNIAKEKEHYEALKKNEQINKKITDDSIAKEKEHYIAIQKNSKLDEQKEKTLKTQQQWLFQQQVALEKIGNFTGVPEAKELVKQYMLQLDTKKELTQEQQYQLVNSKSLAELNKKDALAVQALRKKDEAEISKLNKIEQGNLYELSDLRSKINKSDFADKKTFNDMLDALNKKTLDDNFKRELTSIRKLFDEELKAENAISDARAKKESAFLSSGHANIRFNPQTSAFASSETTQSELELTLRKAINNEMSKSATIAQGYINAMGKGVTISDEKMQNLRNIVAQEEIEKRTLNETLTIQQRLRREEESRARVLEDTIGKQRVMLERMSGSISGRQGEGYTRLTAEITRYQERLRSGQALNQRELNDLRLLEAQTNRNSTSLNDLQNNYLLMRASQEMLQGLKKQIQYVRELDQAVYNLGVVSKFTVSQTEDFKMQLIDMAGQFPVSAKNIAQAMDTIGRTGISFKDNFAAIDDVIRLAVSSGSKLVDTAGINCSSKISLIAGKSYQVSNTKLRQRCA
jgi:hypothetical protein